MNSLDLSLSAINGIPEKIPFNPYIMHMAATLQNISYNHEFCRKPEILADTMIKMPRSLKILLMTLFILPRYHLMPRVLHYFRQLQRNISGS